MITQRDLVQRLARRSLGAWSVVERIQDIAIADELRGLQRRDHRTRLAVIVHQDVPRGRGSARLDLDAQGGSADDLVDQAISLALAAVGPAWTSTPPAAPARVKLVDDDLLKRELADVAANTLARLRRPPDVTVTASAEILREKVTVIASSGFHTSWLATALRAEAIVSTAAGSGTGGSGMGGSGMAASAGASGTPASTGATGTGTSGTGISSTGTGTSGSGTSGSGTSGSGTSGTSSTGTSSTGTSSTGTGSTGTSSTGTGSTGTSGTPARTGACSLTLAREARRIDDLAFEAALADAAADLLQLTAAGPPSPGPCALWLGTEALLHGGDHGVWSIFAHLADSAVERQGLTRYRWRSEIIHGAAQLAEPLSITSNGALDFATRSTPVTDDAVAIRHFPIIQRGIAVGLGLSPREAALRNTDPNGGVRNLVVDPGTWTGTLSPTRRTIEVRRLHALSIDFSTGDATLDIALGLEHRPDRPEPIPFTGGTVRLDLVAALARARRSSQVLRRGPYHGPASVLIDDAELLT